MTGGFCRNRYSSAILPSSQCATVTIVRFPGNVPVTAVQSPAAILIGWANTLLLSGIADTAAIAHCRCWSNPLVVLPVKSTTNTSGLCRSSKSVQFRLFHASKSSLSKRSRLACSSGVCATTISVWLVDDDASSYAIAVKLLKSNPLGLAANMGSNSNENTTTVMPFLLSMVAFDIFRQAQTYPQLYLWLVICYY